nr:hypothetical protein QSJ49_07630 [Halobacterium salinarum]
MSATDGASHHDERTPLSVAADLDVVIDGTPVAVTSTGKRVFVDVPSLAAGVDALAGVPQSELPAFAATLRDADLTVELRVRESPRRGRRRGRRSGAALQAGGCRARRAPCRGSGCRRWQRRHCHGRRRAPPDRGAHVVTSAAEARCQHLPQGDNTYTARGAPYRRRATR